MTPRDHITPPAPPVPDVAARPAPPPPADSTGSAVYLEEPAAAPAPATRRGRRRTAYPQRPQVAYLVIADDREGRRTVVRYERTIGRLRMYLDVAAEMLRQDYGPITVMRALDITDRIIPELQEDQP